MGVFLSCIHRFQECDGLWVHQVILATHCKLRDLWDISPWNFVLGERRAQVEVIHQPTRGCISVMLQSHTQKTRGSRWRCGLLLDAEREIEDVALEGSRRRLPEVEERAGEPLFVFLRSVLGFESDHRCEGQTLQAHIVSTVRTTTGKVRVAVKLTEVMPCGIPYRAPSLCPRECERPSALGWRAGQKAKIICHSRCVARTCTSRA